MNHRMLLVGQKAGSHGFATSIAPAEAFGDLEWLRNPFACRKADACAKHLRVKFPTVNLTRIL